MMNTRASSVHVNNECHAAASAQIVSNLCMIPASTTLEAGVAKNLLSTMHDDWRSNGGCASARLAIIENGRPCNELPVMFVR
jgi:hypothetical protein